MAIKVLRDQFIFILAVMSFLNSCQMTNTGEKNISVLDEELRIEEKDQDLKKVLCQKSLRLIFLRNQMKNLSKQKLNQLLKKKRQLKESYENISSAQKIKDEKRILDFFSDLFKSDEATEKNLKRKYKENDFKKTNNRF